MTKARVALDGVAILVSEPDAEVLFVSSPQARGAATLLLPHYVSVCCDGPPTQTDFRELKGRQVDIWAPGGAAGATWAAGIAGSIFDIAQRVRIVNASDEPHGRDLPNLVADGWNESRAVQWAADHLRVVEEPKTSEVKTGRQHNGQAPVAQAGDSVVASWQALQLECNSGGIPHATLSNASLILQRHPSMCGHIWFDRFRGQIYQDLQAKPLKWTDHDDLRVAAWMQQTMHLPKFTLGLVKEAVTHAALANERNSVTDWLSSLKWDQEPRMDMWLADCLGVGVTPYSQAVARNWLVSMVARAYRPGVQVDHMPILEGKMGRGKSTFLRILGGEWYSALPDAFGSKDFLQGIVGQWLIEVPDLAGFNRREHQHILAIITTPVDRYRASYGRHTEDHPRTCIFTATSETEEYLQDARGRRRFWPLRCESIDLDALVSMRSQLFAEAVSMFRSAATWHEIPEFEADAQQLERVEEDTWSDRILDYVEGRMRTHIGDLIEPVMTSTAILTAVGVELSDQHDGLKRRVKTIMTANGFEQKVRPIQGRSAKQWVKVLK